MKTNIELLKQYKFPRINNSTSVSNLMYKLQTPFDREGKSKSKAVQLGISQAEVLKQWDAKAQKGKAIGTTTHNYIGQVLRGQGQDEFESMSSSKSLYMEQFDLFWAKASKVYRPVWIEMSVISGYYKISGRVDALLYHMADQTFHVVDWKTGKWSDGWNRLKPPFDDLEDSTLDLGAIQTGIYKAAIGQVLGDITLGASYLVHLSENEHNAAAMADISPRITRWLEQEAKYV